MSLKVLFFLSCLVYGSASADIPSDICVGIEFGYLAHPDPQRCTEYIICLFEKFYLFSCSAGHIFYLPYSYCLRGDPYTCELLINVTTLTPTTTTELSTVTTTTERNPLDDLCNGINLGILPHPYDCTKFIVCIYESLNFLNCGASEVFYNGVCVKGNPESCEVTTTTTTIGIDTTMEMFTTTTDAIYTTTEKDVLAAICRGINLAVFPHPEQCTQFIVCVNERPNVLSCDPFEVFHNGTCVEGDPDTCQAFTTTTAPTTTTERVLPDDICLGTLMSFRIHLIALDSYFAFLEILRFIPVHFLLKYSTMEFVLMAIP